MTERWLPVVGHEGFYEVSDQGRVRSVERVVIRSDGKPRRYRSKVLTQSITTTGYPKADLYVASARKTRLTHRMVLEAFVGPCPPGMECCHGWRGPMIAALDNLRWDTSKANKRDAMRAGTFAGYANFAKRWRRAA